jgi:hypothetical protein
MKDGPLEIMGHFLSLYLYIKHYIMNERRHPITVLLNEFVRAFMPKLDQLASPKERVVCARLLKAALEDYIEKNNTE